MYLSHLNVEAHSCSLVLLGNIVKNLVVVHTSILLVELPMALQCSRQPLPDFYRLPFYEHMYFVPAKLNNDTITSSYNTKERNTTYFSF